MRDVESLPVPLVNGWREIQRNPRTAKYGRKVLYSVNRYNTEAGKLVKYLAEFITLDCASDMIALRLFPNGKEISESFAAFEAVRYRLPQFSLTDPTITVVVVGDGATPRTAATFAFRSAWTCYAVDPNVRGGTRRWKAVDRLIVRRARIEDTVISGTRVVLVAVHSHANLERSVAQINATELAVVAIPCCVSMRLKHAPDLEYQDKGIISPCRTVKIWRNVA